MMDLWIGRDESVLGELRPGSVGIGLRLIPDGLEAASATLDSEARSAIIVHPIGVDRPRCLTRYTNGAGVTVRSQPYP